MLRSWKAWILIYDFVMNLLIDHVFDTYLLKVSKLHETCLKPSWNLARGDRTSDPRSSRWVVGLPWDWISNPTLPKTFDKQTLKISSWWKHTKIHPNWQRNIIWTKPNNHVFGFNMLVDSGGVSSKKRWEDLGSHALVRPSNCPRVTDKSSCILCWILDFETERCICGSSKQHVPVSTKKHETDAGAEIFSSYFY